MFCAGEIPIVNAEEVELMCGQCSQLIDSIDLEVFMIAIHLYLRPMDRDPTP
jgi:hypothetical protein